MRKRFFLESIFQRTREILLPLEYTVKHDVNLRHLVEKKNNENLENMVFDIATLANANLTKVPIEAAEFLTNQLKNFHKK